MDSFHAEGIFSANKRSRATLAFDHLWDIYVLLFA